MLVGIIIDTFGELRDNHNAKESMCQNYCMICSISRQRFSQCPGASFSTHIRHSHSITSYLCYLLLLKQKKVEGKELTPQELFVHDCYKHETIDFFPLENTGDLTNEIVNQDADDEVNSQNQRLERLESMVGDLVKRLSNPQP